LLFVPKNSLLPECVRKVLESIILRFLIATERLEKSPETDWFQDFLARCTKKDILLFCVIEGIFSFINQESR